MIIFEKLNTTIVLTMEMWLSVVFEIQRPIENTLFIDGILIFGPIKKPPP